MNNRNPFVAIALTSLLCLTLAGCSRTVEDVNRWEAKGQVEKLIDAFKDPKAEVRIAAAEALGRLQAEAAVDPLAALFQDAESNVVHQAVAALRHIGTGPAASHLMLALKLDDAAVRTQAATGLGQLKSTNAVGELSLLLNDSDSAAQLAAIHALETIAVPAASAALSERLADAPGNLKAACIAALEHTGGADAAPGLIGALADPDESIRTSAAAALRSIGKPCIPTLTNALKNESRAIRRGCLETLADLSATPSSGPDWIWYKLARISTDEETTVDQDLVITLSKKGPDALPVLLDAAAHRDEEIREHAIRAIEHMGTSITARVIAAVKKSGTASAQSWFEERNTWPGAPAPELDLWAALAALNPDFNLDRTKYEYLALKGPEALRILADPNFKTGRTYTPLLIELLGNARCRAAAKARLAEHGSFRILPLMAATQVKDAATANNAAELLGKLGDVRAATPLMKVLGPGIEAGDALTHSPFYVALVRLNIEQAEPMLLKVRPGTDRSIQVFERKYPQTRVMSAETRDGDAGGDEPVTFRLGYLVGHRMGDASVTFEKNDAGHWIPTPALPDALPQ